MTYVRLWLSTSAFRGEADIPDTRCGVANDPKRTFAGVFIPVLSHSPARRLELPFERRNPVAQLDGFELRVHSAGEASKAVKHRTFVCIEIGAHGMRAIER